LDGGENFEAKFIPVSSYGYMLGWSNIGAESSWLSCAYLF